MYVIRVKNSISYTCRRPYYLTSIDDCDVYKSLQGAKNAITASRRDRKIDKNSTWNIKSLDLLEIVQVKLVLV